jgi:hypothetical protein
MKNYNEMANDVFRRIDEYKEKQRRKRKVMIRAVSSLCCVCLAAFIGFGVWKSVIPGQPDITANNESADASINSPAADQSDDTSFNLPAEIYYAVYTDSIQLPEDTSDAEADMIGCLVYKGKVYTATTNFYNYDPEIAEQLVGEYVGEAKGTLDEWSSQEDWATELASTYSGSVYKVNGYSEDFRLCIYVNSGDEQWLQFLDNYDGIGLNTGADLFEERLHITGNVERVTYQTHDDWNAGDTSNDQELSGVTEEQLEDFLTELCNSPFERIDHDSNFYETKTQGHLYLHMKDGTLVELRLMEGGYVGCQELGWIFVKMPGESFDAVFAACQ